MKQIEITLALNLDDEIDEAIYGDFYAFARDNGVPFVQIRENGDWIRINDWKHHRYLATQDTLRRIAKHFIEVGKKMKLNEK